MPLVLVASFSTCVIHFFHTISFTSSSLNISALPLAEIYATTPKEFNSPFSSSITNMKHKIFSSPVESTLGNCVYLWTMPLEAKTVSYSKVLTRTTPTHNIKTVYLHLCSTTFFFLSLFIIIVSYSTIEKACIYPSCYLQRKGPKKQTHPQALRLY